MNVEETLNRWVGVRRGLYEALDRVTDAQLAFAPSEGLWSLGVTALHIASAEEGWFRFVVQHALAGWPSDEDFGLGRFSSVGAIKAALERTHGLTEAFLHAEGDAGLTRPVPVPWGGSMSLADVTWHVLEHEIHHRGEIFLMLGLLGMEAPDV